MARVRSEIVNSHLLERRQGKDEYLVVWNSFVSRALLSNQRTQS